MALNQSPELQRNVFGTQPDANDAADVATPDDIRARIARELERYGAGHEEIADVFARIYDRADRIVRLAEREPDTTAGRLHQMRIEVMTERAFVGIHEGMAAREAQQMAYIGGLFGAPSSDSPDTPLSALDALAA